MNVNKSTKGLTESAIITAIICVLGIAGMYIPFLGILLFIVPTPLIVIGKKYGIKYALMSLVAASVVMISFSSPVTAIFVIALPGIPALVVGILMRKKIKPYHILGATTIAGICTTVFSIFMASEIIGVSVIENMQEIFRQSLDIQEYMYSVAGADAESLNKVKDMMRMMSDMVAVIIPSAIIMAAFFSSYVNYTLATLILKRTGYNVERLKPFRYFRLSKTAVQGILIIGVLSILAGYLEIVDQQTLIINVYLLGQLVFMLQGLAVVVYFLNYYNTSKLLRIIVIVFMILNKIGEMALLVIGLADIFMNIRKYKNENEQNL